MPLTPELPKPLFDSFQQIYSNDCGDLLKFHVVSFRAFYASGTDEATKCPALPQKLSIAANPARDGNMADRDLLCHRLEPFRLPEN